MKKILLGLTAVLLAAALPAYAATYYFVDCATSQAVNQMVGVPNAAHASCAANIGNNANPGTIGSPKKDMVGLTRTTGDVYLFARGSYQVNFKIQPTSTFQSATFDDYTPAWCTGDCATQEPILEARPRAADGFTDEMFFFNTTSTGPWALRDLDMRGLHDWRNYGRGIYFYGETPNVTMERLRIAGFNLGILYLNSLPIKHANHVLRDSLVENNRDGGQLGAGDNLLMEGNTFRYNAHVNYSYPAGAGLQPHNVYFNGYAHGVTVRRNLFTKNNVYPNHGAGADTGFCYTSGTMGHGKLTNFTFEGNTHMENDATNTNGCWGLLFDGNSSGGTSNTRHDWTNLVMRDNLVVTRNAGVSMGCQACPNALIENNTVIRPGSTGQAQGILVPVQNTYYDPGWDAPYGSVTVRNNTVYIESSSSISNGVRVGSGNSTSTATWPDWGNAQRVTNNVVIYAHPTTNVGSKCFYWIMDFSYFQIIDHNACFADTAVQWSDKHATLTLAQAATTPAGMDDNSIFGSLASAMLKAAPSAANGWRIEFNSGSPVVNAGHATHRSKYGFGGKAKKTPGDVGACDRPASGNECGTDLPSAPYPPRVQTP
jgi:hypothetical protein